MAFDIEVIKKVYARMGERVNSARNLTGKPLTLAEKILYSHLWDVILTRCLKEVKIMLILLRPSSMSRCDCTNALLQFMHAGKPKVAVPTTVHCDHPFKLKKSC